MTLLTSIAQHVLKIDMKTIPEIDSEVLMNVFTSSYRLLLVELYPATEVFDLSIGRSAQLKCKSIANKLASAYKRLPGVSNDEEFLSYLNAKEFQSSLGISDSSSSVSSKKRKGTTRGRRHKRKKGSTVDDESDRSSDVEDQDESAELLSRQSIFEDHGEVQSHFWTNLGTTLGLL